MITCNNCEWRGEEEDLVRGEDEDGFFDGCPNCKTDGYLADIKVFKITVEQYGVFSDGTINKAVIFVKDTVFSRRRDTRIFIAVIKKSLGFINYTLVES